MKNNEGKFRNIISNKDSHFKIKIEDIREFNNSFFKDVYEEATKNLCDIIDNNLDYYLEKDKSKDNSKFRYMDKEEKNNIIAFAGERGAGKTSAMVSFAGALSADIKEGFEPMSNLTDKKFWVLNSIDPSLFEENESIFQVVIAKLFEEFRREIENDSNKINEQSEIIRTFERVYKNFKVISSGDRYNDNISLDDTLEALSNLAASSSMRENFMKLVKLLLEYKFGKDRLKNSYLVLSIDDLDMNINKSSDMAEQIRKYLLIPNVIILMAVKVEQLKDSVEQMFRKEYEIMSKNKIELEDDPKNMAARYIEKLIPNGRKVYLPNFKIGDNLDNVKIEIRPDNGQKIEYTNGVQECVLGMIYRKTGLIFIKPKEGIHQLIPDNMRELQNLLAILSKLDDIDFYINENINKNETFIGIHPKNRQDLIKNVDVFEKYFYATWIKRNLDSKCINIIEEFKLKPIEAKNKFIIGKLAELKLLENEESKINTLQIYEFGEYVDTKNKSYNLSLGDVLDVLDINKDYDSENMQKLKFAIKTVYSLEIHKRLYSAEYDEIEIDEGEEELGDKLNYYMSNSKGINDVYKLTAGNVLGKIYSELTRKSNNDRSFNRERDTWKINEYNKIPIDINFKNNSLVASMDSIIKFLHSSSNDEKKIDKLVDDMINDKRLDKSQKESLKKSMELYLKDFELDSKISIKLLHNFIYQGYDLNSNYRRGDNKYYDTEVNISTGFANKSAVFSIYLPITKALKTNNIYKNIIKLKRNVYKENNIDIKEDMIKYIDINNSYMILPLNSIESLEYIKEYLYKNKNRYLDNKYVNDDSEYFESIVRTSYKLLYDSLKDLTKSTNYINDSQNLLLRQINMFPLTNYIINDNLKEKENLKFNTLAKNINSVRHYNRKSGTELKKLREEETYIINLIKDLNQCKTKVRNGNLPTYNTLRKKWSIFKLILEKYRFNIQETEMIGNLSKLITEKNKENIGLLKNDNRLRAEFFVLFEECIELMLNNLNKVLDDIKANIKNIGE
ncbi:hypothetical protein [Paraclostridium sordellii]|uniref:hypothetical protein n=1 Tax=Paraclostridium sordellii TaxID=1505 RepID=UPI0030D0E757